MDTTPLLDIHTHHPEYARQAIVNHPFLSEAESSSASFQTPSDFYSAGIHPWELTAQNADEQWTFLQSHAGKEMFVAVGEAGLDKLSSAPMELQTAMFERQVEFSEEHGLPLIIHCVKAMEELLAVRNRLHPIQPWIWHGFRGKPQQAEQLLKSGLYLSFGEHYSETTLRMVPADRLFLETDDGQMDIESLLDRVASIRAVDRERLRQIIRRNIQKVFFKR